MATATNSSALPKNSLRKKSTLGKRIMRNWQLYIFILPAFLYFLIFHYVPMYGVQIAFKDFSPALGITGSPWAGMKHFIRFFNLTGVESFSDIGPALVGFLQTTPWKIIKNTVILSAYTLLVSFPIPVLLALMLNEVRSNRYKKLVQNITYAPNFISTVVMVGMINLFFADSGIINALLGKIGIESVSFLMNAGAFRHLYVWTGVWQGAGYASVIYFAALAGVDPQLHEAATIDGATRLQRIIHINIPAILPTVVIMLIMQVGTIMNISFEKIYLMQNSINLDVSQVISTYVYQIGLGVGGKAPMYSYAAAIGLLNNVINLILLLIVNKVSAKLTETSLW